MATVDAVLDAIESTLSAAGIRPVTLGNVPHPPCAQVAWNGLDYSRTMQNGITDWDLRVRYYAGLTSNRSAFDEIKAKCDPTTSTAMKAILEADKTQGGVVEDTHVSAVGPPQAYNQDDGTTLLGVEFTVLVIAP